MTQIALYDYLEQIHQFLENEQTTEAIAHCRYVLRQCPRHVDTYRLLARALLENREFDDAAELFRRILSADPNDFVAHVGLAEVYREEGELSEAVWHMERAFEMSPYEPAVYEVLRELYVQRDGGTLTEVPLTRAALARLYFKGELYQEAATELQAVLQQNGDDRVDLEVLLSETLWRDNQRVDAVAVALQVLEKLPDSITVNAILGEVWLLTGRTEEAQGYLQHLLLLTQMDQKHLDPDSVAGQALQTDGAPPLPKTIVVERWRATADADRFDAGSREGTEQPIEDEAVYDWLRDEGGTGKLGVLEGEEDEVDWFTDHPEPTVDQEETFAKTAEWLERLGVEPESGDDFDFAPDVPAEPMAEDEMPALVDESLDWVEETADAPALDEFVHDWLTELDDVPVETAEEGEKGQPNWFTSPMAEEDDEPVELFEEGEETQTDWFISPVTEEVEAEELDWFAAPLDEESEMEGPDWFDLTEDEDEVALPESKELHTADLLAQADDGDLDWLVEDEEATLINDSGELAELAEALFADESLAGDDEEMPDWLMEIGESPESLDFEEPGREDKFGLFASEEDLFASDMSDEEEEESQLDFDTADLLANADEGLPDWLMEEGPPEEESMMGGVSDILGSTDSLVDADLPDWLSDVDETAEAEPEEEASRLVQRMNRIMGTEELFADEAEDAEFDEEDEVPESEPLSLTGLLLGTAELVEKEGSDEALDGDDETDEADELAEMDYPGLLGTAELLADLDADVPDWLRGDSGQEDEELESPLLHTADLQGDNLDEVPHWLSAEEETEEDELTEEPPESGTHKPGLIGTAELFASLGEDVPDWIVGTDEEEDEKEDVFADGQSGIMGTTDLLAELDADSPDWAGEKQEITDWQNADDGDDRDEIQADEEEDAWLVDETPVDEAIADIVEEATPLTKSLLDWLSGETEGDEEMTFDEAEEEEFPDWLFSDTSQDEMEAVIMADNEQENNLEGMPEDSDDMDWLEELVAQDDAPDIPQRVPAENEADLPDWLSGLTEPATDSEAALSEVEDVPLTLTDSDLPDWLKDLGEAAAPAQPRIGGSMDNLPDWLKPPPDLDLGSAEDEDSDLSELMEAEVQAEFAADVVGEDADDLLDFDEVDKADKDDTSQIWLDALTADEDDSDFELESMFEVDEPGFDADEDVELPDWLAAADDEAVDVSETADTDEDEALFDFLSESVGEDVFALDDMGDDLDLDQAEDDVSDWLAALTDADEGDWDETAAGDEDLLALLAEPDTESVLDFDEADDGEEVAGMPDWLMEAAGEEDETAVDFAGDEDEELLPELDLDSEDELALDDPMAWLDQLAVEQDEPVEDLPSVLDTSMYDTFQTDEYTDITEEAELPDAESAEIAGEWDLMDALDEEPALSWLEELDEADDFDELTTVVEDTADSALTDFDMAVDELPEDEADLTLAAADDELALDWLDALDESETALAEEMETAVAPEEDSLETVVVPDDLEEAMAWLDNLEAEEEEDLLEDLLTLDELSLMEESVDVGGTADTDEDEIDWLAELAAEETDEAVDELPTVAEVEIEPEPPDPLQAALDRLEELALQDSTSFVTADVPDTDEAAQPESLDDVLNWLETQLASPAQEEMTDEPTEAVVDSEDILEADTFIDEMLADEAVDTMLDDEIAALEEEVVIEVEETADESLLEEIPDFTEEAAEADEMSDDDILAFMDAILGDEDSFIPEKDVSFTPDDPDAIPSFAVSAPEAVEEPEAESDDFVDALPDMAVEEDEEAVLVGMYDDLSGDMSDDDILAFMDAILDDADSFVPEKDVSFTPDDPNAVASFAVTKTADEEPEEADLVELADDPEADIAWLQDLVDAEDRAVESGGTEDLDSILPEIDEDFAAGLFAGVAEVEETADTQDAIEFDETLADSLPDWLEFDGEERLAGHTDWLRSLPEPDVAGWLEAEEEVMASNIFDEIPVPAEPERPSAYAADFEDMSMLEPEPELVEEELDEEPSVPGFSLNTGTLDLARQALAKGQYDQAMKQYRSLVEDGQGLSTLIADLETATDEYQQPRLRRLLGDAYMRNGQLQRALETYRIALDEL